MGQASLIIHLFNSFQYLLQIYLISVSFVDMESKTVFRPETKYMIGLISVSPVTVACKTIFRPEKKKSRKQMIINGYLSICEQQKNV